MLYTYDTHAHLDQLENLSQALENADKGGVKGIVAVSMDVASCRKTLEIKKQFQSPRIYCAMGIHPSEAKESDVQECVRLIRDQRAQLCAVGEIGLDFWYKWVRKDQEKKDEQRRVFRALLEVAKELDLPVVIHSRGTWRECLDTTREVGLKRAVFHWYSGPVDVLEDIIQAGYFISTAPSVAYSPQSREAVMHTPIEHQLIETDCPVYFKNQETGEGFQAEPRDVFRTLDAYCALKKLDKQKAANVLNQNACQFFGMN